MNPVNSPPLSHEDLYKSHEDLYKSHADLHKRVDPFANFLDECVTR